MFALIDCNNFYVSCERVFNPKLRGIPCVVLSNNDACIISRSQEAKDLKVPMGAVYFKWLSFLKQHSVAVCSSNYALYGDMSQRVMSVLGAGSSTVEVYSIDEAFVHFSDRETSNLLKESLALKQMVYQWTGIPVSIGIGPTKTLAKVANYIAKCRTETNVYEISRVENTDELLESIAVENIWGIGRQNSTLLRCRGITTARALRDADDKWIRKHLSVLGLRCVWELRGVACLSLDTQVDPKKGIMCSRSFGRSVTELSELSEALATYTSKAAEKLRAQHSVVGALRVSLRTNHYRRDLPQYANSSFTTLNVATADTCSLIKVATQLLEKLYKPMFRYQKVAVMLLDLQPNNVQQMNFFDAGVDSLRSKRMMKTLDSINACLGSDTVKIAASGITRPWSFRCDLRSQRFTTNWQEIPIVRGGFAC